MEWIVLIGAPVLAFLGSWLGQRANRQSAKELDRWRKREETMRMLRWGLELATDPDDRKSRAGIAALDQLKKSELLDTADMEFVAELAGQVADPDLPDWSPPA